MILTRRELKFDLVLSLQVTCDVRMIAVVEALLLKNLLDAKDVFLQILRHFVQIVHVFVERYHLDNFDEIDEITRGHAGRKLSFGNDNQEEMT